MNAPKDPAGGPMSPHSMAITVPPRTKPRTLRRRLARHPQLVVGLAVLTVFVLIAFFGDWLAPYSVRVQTGEVYEPPSAEHWLGTDDGGIDMLSLLLAGTKVSMFVAFAATAVSMLIGGVIGIVSGFVGGWLDNVLMRITDVVIVIPSIPLMFVMAAMFGSSLFNVIIIIGITSWAYTARVIRAQVVSLRERTYVKRARSIGARDGRLILHHVLPHVAPLLIANTVLSVSYSIFAETFITFLGLGSPNAISWGRLIQNSFQGNAVLSDAWWAILPPGLAVAVVVLACTLVGQAIEDLLNPRLKVGHLSPRPFRVRPVPEKGA